MPKKFAILLEDDWEVMGNGLGNVAQLQYLPSLFLMKTLKKLGATMTFMVDVVHQLRYLQPDIRDRNLVLQSKLWEENVLLMQDYGFDVQLHLHPQWFGAPREGEHFLVSKVWNIGLYSEADKQQIIAGGIDYLEGLLRKQDPAYKVIAFKGGSWGLQPSQDLFRILGEKGVRIVMGVRNDLKLPKSGTDYTNTEERVMPYYPDYNDIRKVSAKQEEIVIIPQPEYAPALPALFSLGWDMLRQKWQGSDDTRYYYGERIPAAVRQVSPLLGENKLHAGLRPYKTHLKIGNQPFSYLKASIDAVIGRLKNSEFPRIPLVLESHTKNYIHHYSHIEKFLGYIQDKYGEQAEFTTLRAFHQELVDHPEMIRKRN